ncbi:MAG TPA: S49 family peptidase, partial [Candidatus Binataceae bacterium]
EQVARGRVWSGLAARERGLVDELGGLAKAVEIARERAHIPADQAHQLVSYSVPSGLMGLKLSVTPASIPWGIGLAARALGVPVRWAPAMFELAARGGITLLCPFLEL